MENTITYISILIHAILVFLLWLFIYRRLAPNKWRLNKSIWIAGGILILYIIVISAIAWEMSAIWFDYAFFGPCFLLFYFVFFALLLNLVYTIVLGVRKNKDSSSKQL